MMIEKAVILTYKILKGNSYANLIKMGFKPEQILNKLARFYLKEGRQLIIPRIVKDGKTLFDYKALRKAVNDLNKGRVRMGKVIDVTIQAKNKLNIKSLKQAIRTLGKDSFANKLYNEYLGGEVNVYQLDKSVYNYINNMAEYEPKYNVDKNNLTPIIEGYNE